MIDVWVDGERIEIRGLDGSDLHHRAPRSARNSKTDKAINLPAKVGVHFKPGQEMRDRVNAARHQYRIRE